MDTFCCSVQSYKESNLGLLTFSFVNSLVDLMTHIRRFGSPISVGVGSSFTLSIVGGESKILTSWRYKLLLIHVIWVLVCWRTMDLIVISNRKSSDPMRVHGL
jgi:hypothetical protein